MEGTGSQASRFTEPSEHRKHLRPRRIGRVRALILELVEGPTLAERIQEGPILVEETLSIARQIAEALEAGHEVSVIHRDVKPAKRFRDIVSRQVVW